MHKHITHTHFYSYRCAQQQDNTHTKTHKGRHARTGRSGSAVNTVYSVTSSQASQRSILSSELSKKPEVSFPWGPNLEHDTWIMKSKQDWPRCLQQCQLVFSPNPACRIERTGRDKGREKKGEDRLFISKHTSQQSPLSLHHHTLVPALHHIQANV